jgi:hypothetical protein
MSQTKTLTLPKKINDTRKIDYQRDRISYLRLHLNYWQLSRMQRDMQNLVSP